MTIHDLSLQLLPGSHVPNPYRLQQQPYMSHDAVAKHTGNEQMVDNGHRDAGCDFGPLAAVSAASLAHLIIAAADQV
jgi:hypothetical protein